MTNTMKMYVRSEGKVQREKAYVERNIAMPSIHQPSCEPCVAGHGTMNRALSKKSTVNVVCCVARNSSDHVCGIW